eukprot:gb/GECH01001451.1/.p1 GENE.gb/GECH01001451.1/~~gb/GECH01001451.1/.p1  ORF type:complete len:144 (+),score=33.02 gb/GECH01001451.1/:1-432(+)
MSTDRDQGYIYHITTKTEWQAAQQSQPETLKQTNYDNHNLNYYRHSSLETEGFIHCSTYSQIVGTLNRFFRSTEPSSLVILKIKTDELIPDSSSTSSNPLVYEQADPSLPPFPHVYAPIPIAAVVGTLYPQKNEDGDYSNVKE